MLLDLEATEVIKVILVISIN